jgi:hypothetical protein
MKFLYFEIFISHYTQSAKKFAYKINGRNNANFCCITYLNITYILILFIVKQKKNEKFIYL